MSEVGLRLEGVSLERPAPGGGTRTVLDGLDATFLPGEVTVVAGPSGCGKTSLLALLAVLLRPTRGTVFASGEPVSRFRAAHRDAFRRQVGLAFQSPRLVAGLTALENVLLPAVPLGVPLVEARQAGLAALDALGAAELAGREVSALSGGERQRVEVARALARAPRHLLLDEPSAHQDPRTLARLVAAVETARERGAVVVVATHDPRLLEALPAARRLRLAGSG